MLMLQLCVLRAAVAAALRYGDWLRRRFATLETDG